jgi:hypothetical protein
MKTQTYIKNFNNENDAIDMCRIKNEANRCEYTMYAVVDGPNDDYAVVDIKTAIELGCGYKIVGAKKIA